ncbi:uncharacterized protein LOC112127049 [Cimex lectularius]|uniref:Dual specificity phosphatase catalytic domain-containing protein n=1 Tax=Cimex lectularius TaxID=79782 RepID=A0A8I6SL86_CIMLE|nr:uncharacterized protein LOC112127049 [Cimex lectularius]
MSMILAGMSRSVTVAVAYIMSVTTLNWKEALKVVKVGRSVANPNVGFQKQLEEFEMTKLYEERRRIKERFPSLALVAKDEAECQILLNSYEGLLLSKHLCEGNCPMGEVCPTGLCRSPSKTTGLIWWKSTHALLTLTSEVREKWCAQLMGIRQRMDVSGKSVCGRLDRPTVFFCIKICSTPYPAVP